jgi:cell fate regulator YaaT (PSP1 superfamily)
MGIQKTEFKIMYRVLKLQLEDETVLKAVSPAELALHPGDQCVVECNHLPEFGTIVALKECEGAMPGKGNHYMALRRATLQDQARARENTVVGHMAAKTVAKRMEAAKLPMHIVQVRYSFDRAVLHVTYTSEDRVECGELIRALATELRTHVEMRQIGARDSARLIGGTGVCGRTLCCKAFLKEFEAVSVKMAKAQRLALNPASIGGACGRLKCCLKYEFECYRSMGEKLPPDGAMVRCAEGVCRMVDKDIMRQRVKVRTADGRVIEYDGGSVDVVQDEDNKRARNKEKR